MDGSTTEPGRALSDSAAVGTPVPSVSVVMPVYGHPGGIERCLRALVAAEPKELVVVVDGGDPSTERLAVSLGACVVALPDRRGPAAARNLGVRHASGDVVLFIDSDVVVPPDVVRRVRDAFVQDQGLHALFGSYDDAPADPGFVSQYRNLLHHWVHQHASADATTFWGACGAVRRRVFLEAGGFDERFREPSIEDIELGNRLFGRGYRIRLDPSLQVTHLKRWTFVEMVRTDLLRRAAPWTELILRSRAAGNDLNLTYRDRSCVVLAGIGVGGMALSPFAPAALTATAAAAAAIPLLNLSFLGFLRRRRGVLFALRAAPVHTLFYVVGGFGFLLGLGRIVCASVRPGTRAHRARRTRPGGRGKADLG